MIFDDQLLDAMHDAPPAMGELFIKAVREQNKALFVALINRPFVYWGKYHEQLTKEEQRWTADNTPSPEPNEYDDYY